MVNVWDTTDEMVGERITIALGDWAYESAVVLAVHRTKDLFKVRADDGAILVGNQWD